MRAAARLTAITRAAVLWKLRAELLVSIALLAGWALLTWGVAELTTRYAWHISAGLLLLSLCGWRFLKTLVMRGLYVLSQGKDA